MKTKYIVCMVLMLFSKSLVYAQGQNNIWTMGGGAGVNFNTSPPSFYASSCYAVESYGSICDHLGNLLFYCSGGNLYNRSHAPMPHSFTVGDASTAQGIAIAPVDDNDSLFFVFNLGSILSSGKLLYGIVNMNLDGGKGDLDLTYGTPQLLDTLSEQMVFAGKCKNKWLLVHHRDSSRFYAYRIAGTPALGLPVISNVGLPHRHKNYGVGQMKVSPDAKTVALSTLRFGIELYDFDVLTGMLSNYRVLDSSMGANYGIEFSADGSKLYASLGDYGVGLHQYDLSAGSRAAIAASKYTIRPERTFGLRRGPDQMVYAIIYWHNNISRIRKPNLPGALCDFQLNILPTIPLYTYMGIGLGVNFPWQGDTNFHLYTHNLCTDDTITLSGSGYRSYFWSDGSTGPVKKVSGKEAVHQLFSVSGCVVRSDSFIIHEYPNAYNSSYTDTVLCLPGYMDLTAKEGAESFVWNDGSTLKTKRVTGTGLYWVTASKKCGFDRDTFNVTAKPLSTAVQVKDTTFCFLNEAIVSAPDTFTSYTWAGGSNKKDTLIKSSGKYLVTAKNDSTCHAVTISNNVRLIKPFPALKDLYPCLRDSVLLDAGTEYPDATYEWSTGARTPSIKVWPPASSFVFVRVGNCVSVDTISAIYSPLAIDLGKNKTGCIGEQLTLHSGIEGYQYQWSTGATSADIEVSESGTYILKAYNDTCSGTAEVKVSFVNCSECAVIPNAFTPNADGINDRFKPILTCPVLSYELSVVNRWGQVLFTTKSPNEGWDGAADGLPVNNNVYYYILKVKFDAQDNGEKLYKGDVTLIR